MKTAITPLQLLRPASLAEALGMLADDPALIPLAGCTDIYVELNFGTSRAQRFVDIWGLDELKGISADGDVLRLGALTTHAALMQSHLVIERVPILAQAASQIGGIQIQNRGTIGGNIANGSPAGDTLPVLSAADAVVVIRGASGERRVPFNSFYSAYRKTVLNAGEIIAAVEISRIDGAQWYRKVGTRAAQAISKIVMAGVRGESTRIALGSVAATVVRLPRTEAAIDAGSSPDEIVRIMESEIHPIDDIRSTAAYRLRVAGNLIRRFLADTR